MQKLLKIGVLKFEIKHTEEGPELELENDTSMVYEKISLDKAKELKQLLSQYIESVKLHKELQEKN